MPHLGPGRPERDTGLTNKGDSLLRYLITGGAGFIGSHLADRLSADGHEVLVLDDLSTGRIANVESLLRSGRAEFVEGSVLDEELVLELLGEVDACLHLASVVGVSLVVDEPVDTLLNNVRGADVVLSAAAARQKRVLFASTSEVYGKLSNGALTEHSDRIYGETQKSRWNYATSKSFGEALALGYHKELGAENIVVRLFNTVGPRQSGAYGMVLPRFARQAVSGDAADRLRRRHADPLLRARARHGRSPHAAARLRPRASDRSSTSAARRRSRSSSLARRVIARSGSGSEVDFVPYERRLRRGLRGARTAPARHDSAPRELTGWEPRRTIDDAIDDVVRFERAACMSGARRRGASALPDELRLALALRARRRRRRSRPSRWRSGSRGGRASSTGPSATRSTGGPRRTSAGSA